MIREVSLKNPVRGSVDLKRQPKRQAEIDQAEIIASELRDLSKRFYAGEKIYLMINEGERKGSIALLDSILYGRGENRWTREERENKKPYLDGHLSHGGFRGTDEWVNFDLGGEITIKFTGRSSKPKYHIGATDVTWLDGYMGPTIYKMFDAKGEAAKAAKKVKVYDRKEKELKVGDKVVYINSRYGSGSGLDFGKVVKIDVKVKLSYNDGSKYSEVHVHVERDDDKMLSKIGDPVSYILKM